MGDGAGLSWPVKKNELRGKRKPIDVTFVMWAGRARPLIERGARRSHMVDETLPASGDAGQACVARGRQVAAPLLDDGLSDVRDPLRGRRRTAIRYRREHGGDYPDNMPQA